MDYRLLLSVIGTRVIVMTVYEPLTADEHRLLAAAEQIYAQVGEPAVAALLEVLYCANRFPWKLGDSYCSKRS